jgi:hypothetical protein
VVRTGSGQDSWDIQQVRHSASMRLGQHQREVRMVLPQGRSTNSGHSRGVLFHHTQLVEQYNPGHSPENLLDPRLMVVPAQGAHDALCLPAGVVQIFQ